MSTLLRNEILKCLFKKRRKDDNERCGFNEQNSKQLYTSQGQCHVLIRNQLFKKNETEILHL